MGHAADDNLIWIDLEMTGLDPATDSIIEVATVVTDRNLEVLAEGPQFAIRHEEARLLAMDDWNRSHHTKSGLWQRVLESGTSHANAESETIAFLESWVPPGKSPMCGNSICQDRRFLYRQMPALERYFHYRNLDVSTLKELARRWAPAVYKGFSKDSAHTALSDIHDSIEELRYYRVHMGELAGLAAAG
jgi:oligoribonuclease